MKNLKKYVITINESFLRDCQIYSGDIAHDEDGCLEYDIDSDDWSDFCPTAFLSIEKATSEKEAIKLAYKRFEGQYSEFLLDALEI